MGTAGGVPLSSGSNPRPSDCLSVKDSVHFGQQWKYLKQMGWPELFSTYLPPLYNALHELHATPSIHLTVPSARNETQHRECDLASKGLACFQHKSNAIKFHSRASTRHVVETSTQAL